MNSVTIFDLLAMDRHTVTNRVNASELKVIDIVYPDGTVVKSTAKELIYSSYFWDILRAYPQTPNTPKHHVQSVLKGKPLTSNTHIELLGNIMNDVIDAYQLVTPESKEHLLGLVYEVTNNTYNEITQLAEADVATIDILDFIDVVEHPAVKNAIESTENTHESITQTYKVVLDTINSDPALAKNGLVRAVNSKMVNNNQVTQCVAVRGFPTEVDGAIMKTAILSNYTLGMNTLYDYMMESRSAAKALYFSESPLQDAEYFARRLQLLAMVCERIAYEDCGSTQYLPWRITPPSEDERGAVTYPGDLKFMVGKFYMDEDSGTLKEIKGNETQLYGKLVMLRSVLFCKHSDPHAVCSTCFGGLSKNVSRFANLGHLCAATMTQQTSQSVLSIKHLDASSVSANIVITGPAMKFLTTNRAKNAYLVRKELADKHPRIVVSREEAIGLTDILAIDDAANISPMRVSSIEAIEFLLNVKGEESSTPIYVNQGNRFAILTTEFLSYLKARRWETDSRNNFVFDLSEWNFSLPIMKLPDMEYSFSDHSHQIAKLIESSMKNITDRNTPNSPVSTLQELFGLVNSKLNVNIAALEVLIYATMIPEKDSYALARNKQGPVLGIADLVIKRRSLGAAYAYEDTSLTLVDPRSFFKLDRVDGPLDAMITPREVVKHYKKIGLA